MKTDCQKEHGKQKRAVEEEEENQSWKDCDKRDIERAGMTCQEWKPTAEDRGEWRTLTMKKQSSDLDLTSQGSKGKKKEIVVFYCIFEKSTFI